MMRFMDFIAALYGWLTWFVTAPMKLLTNNNNSSATRASGMPDEDVVKYSFEDFVAALFDGLTWLFVTAPMQLLLTSSSATTRYNSSGMPKLPNEVVKYSQVPQNGGFLFKDTIPKGLLREHNTRAGTWGVIRVYKGELEYIISEPTESTHVLNKNTPGIIEPTMHHRIRPITDDVELVVEFYRKQQQVEEKKRKGH
mmetsp:Transcript_21573/g.31908  ORF Transcript_21573/g.31908 Transcript_21573/m.31908 type:complete len:197 (+) Transcript_21573:35-625(+)